MITVIAVGKIKERYLREGIDDYLKRLTRFGKTEIIEIAEENCDVNPALAVSAEGKKMADRIPKGAYLIGLDVQGKQWTSEGFSEKIQSLFTAGNSHICFLIGGSCGLSAEIKARCDELISFSKMTFPHQLFRMILMEQIYRAFKIMQNETYHK
ncbi:MAG: 23S rRNA (pseudouridine(1915)-N(3))-methyltransferase RlmH [Anaerofustis sp.]